MSFILSFLFPAPPLLQRIFSMLLVREKLSFSISYPDLIESPYFADTTQGGVKGGPKIGWRLGDFQHISVSCLQCRSWGFYIREICQIIQTQDQNQGHNPVFGGKERLRYKTTKIVNYHTTGIEIPFSTKEFDAEFLVLWRQSFILGYTNVLCFYFCLMLCPFYVFSFGCAFKFCEIYLGYWFFFPNFTHFTNNFHLRMN